MFKWPQKQGKPQVTILGKPEPLKKRGTDSNQAKEPLLKIQGKEPLLMPPPSKDIETGRKDSSLSRKPSREMPPGISLTIGKKSGDGSFQVVATSAFFPGRKEQVQFKIPFEEEHFDKMLSDLSRKVQDPRAAMSATIPVVVRGEDGLAEAEIERPLIETLGQSLFSGLFRDGLKEIYVETFAKAEAQFPISIETNNPEVARLPWEFLHDGERYLCTNVGPIFRVVLGAPPTLSDMQMTEPLRLLIVPTNPAGQIAIDYSEEVEDIKSILRDTNSIIELPGSHKIEAFMQKLLSYKPHVIHFIGHGDENGNILFKNDLGDLKPIGDELCGMMQSLSSAQDNQARLPRLIILNACNTATTHINRQRLGLAAQLIMNRVPMVVAMQFTISDIAAKAFARGFYEYVAAGLPLHRATAWGRLTIMVRLQETVEWATPVVYANPKVNLG
jgi:hypothetical protein